jgi:hypothetical protein
MVREFAAAGPAELLENGARIAPLSTFSSIVPAREAISYHPTCPREKW